MMGGPSEEGGAQLWGLTCVSVSACFLASGSHKLLPCPDHLCPAAGLISLSHNSGHSPFLLKPRDSASHLQENSQGLAWPPGPIQPLHFLLLPLLPEPSPDVVRCSWHGPHTFRPTVSSARNSSAFPVTQPAQCPPSSPQNQEKSPIL